MSSINSAFVQVGHGVRECRPDRQLVLAASSKPSRQNFRHSASRFRSLGVGIEPVIFFRPKRRNAVITTLSERPWASLGIGFIAAVVVPVVCALLFATVLAVPLGLILLFAFFILLYWSRIYAIGRIGESNGAGWEAIVLDSC